jgi:hypothetical protein
MKGNVFAIVLTSVVAVLVGGFLWWDHQHSLPLAAPSGKFATPGEAERVHAPPRRAPTAYGAEKPFPTGQGIYRCEGPGGTVYQSAPCQAGTKQAELKGGTFSIVAPPPAPRDFSSATRRVAPSEAKLVGPLAHTTPPEPGNEGACRAHEAAIKKIDAAGRVGGTSWKMERLREQRRDHKDAMWVLKCGF